MLTSSIGCRTALPLASPAEVISARHPRTLLLTVDDSVVRMSDGDLAGDTVVGLVKGQRTAIPLSRLTEVRAVVAAPAKTAELAVAVSGAAVLAVWMIGRWLTAPSANGRPDTCGNADPSSCQ